MEHLWSSHELHMFASGVHGLSLADENTDDQGRFINPRAQIWIDLALRWLKGQFEQSLQQDGRALEADTTI